MKNLTIFSTSTAYENATLELPNVSLIEDGMEVRYTPTIDYSKQYLTFECLTVGTITITASHASVYKTISYSIDNGSTWTNLTTSTTAQSLGTFVVGDKLLVKGSNNAYGMKPVPVEYRNYFGGTAQVKVYGNIMSLIYGDDFIGQTAFPPESTYNFYELFDSYQNLIDASNLILPVTMLSVNCYNSMFFGCTNLINTPTLPATTLVQSCYYYMFCNCSSLVSAPELPATTLAVNCYKGMFEACTSLIQAPNVPDSIKPVASNYCYEMFFESSVPQNSDYNYTAWMED